MRHLPLILIMIFLFSCSEEHQDLAKDNTIQMVFNKNEITDLLKILNFFEQSIGLKENKSDDELQKAYSDFFTLNKDIKMTSELRFSFDYTDMMELLRQIDKLTLQEIWVNKPVKLTSMTDSVNVFEINYNGKYMRFLQRLGEQDKKINNYYNIIQIAGDLSPSLAADIAKNYKSYNIYDPKIRLVIAIHYLTLNDKMKRN